jgi:hypothetical protein
VPLPPVYSKRFAEVAVLPLGGSLLGTVPAGFIWIVRSATFFNGEAWSVGLFGCWLTTGTGVFFAGVGQADAQGNRVYTWEGRQVLESGENLLASASDDFWSVVVSGYELSTP